MKIKFIWVLDEAYGKKFLSPSVIVTETEEGYKGCFSCLLTDDGGCGYLRGMEFFKEGLIQIASVRDKQEIMVDWSANYWGSEITLDGVKVYSLCEESYFDMMTLDAFEKVITTWLDFIQSEPNVDNRVEIEV